MIILKKLHNGAEYEWRRPNIRIKRVRHDGSIYYEYVLLLEYRDGKYYYMKR